MFLKLHKLHSYIGKTPFIAYQITGQCLCSVTSTKYLKILSTTVLKIFTKCPIFLLKFKSASAITEKKGVGIFNFNG